MSLGQVHPMSVPYSLAALFMFLLKLSKKTTHILDCFYLQFHFYSSMLATHEEGLLIMYPGLQFGTRIGESGPGFEEKKSPQQLKFVTTSV